MRSPYRDRRTREDNAVFDMSFDTQRKLAIIGTSPRTGRSYRCTLQPEAFNEGQMFNLTFNCPV